MTKSHPQRRRSLFGRRVGHALKSTSKERYDRLFPSLQLTLPEDPAQTVDVAGLFAEPTTALWLEVGFGGGEHLAWQVKHNPHVGMIGCEPFLNGISNCLKHLDGSGQEGRVRIYNDDAREVMAQLPDGCLDRMFLLHPDPWPKTKHHKRRFIQPEALDEAARLLKDNAIFRVGTDHMGYAAWTMRHMMNHPAFEWTAEGPGDWLDRPDDWPKTRYEEKAKAGRAVYLAFRRLPRD